MHNQQMIAGQLEQAPVRRDDMSKVCRQGSHDLQVAIQRVMDIRELESLKKVYGVIHLGVRGECMSVLTDDEHAVPDTKPASHAKKVSHKTEGKGVILPINRQQRRLKEGLLRRFDHESGVDQKAVLSPHHGR
jgi:hypothetical protein